MTNRVTVCDTSKTILNTFIETNNETIVNLFFFRKTKTIKFYFDRVRFVALCKFPAYTFQRKR